MAIVIDLVLDLIGLCLLLIENNSDKLMLRKGIRKYIFNPVLGLLPFVLYLQLHTFTNIKELYAICIPLLVAILGENFLRCRFKTKMYSLTFYISIVSLASTLLFSLFTGTLEHAPCSYIIFCEIILVTLLVVLRVSKIYLVTLFFRRKDVIQKAWLNEFYHVATILQYGLIIHLFIELIYLNFKFIDLEYWVFDIIVLNVIPTLFLLSVGMYHISRTTNMISKLRKEEWLPIVTEKGEVTGKIARSVSLKMKNKFMHPVVRVALVSNGKVYLQERTASSVIDLGKLDYPFEKYMLFNHEINLAARNSISKMMGDKMNMPLKFLLKYVLENDETKRLVLFFVATIDDENAIKRKGKMKGKFWTIKQIEDAFADEVFSESFELEFEYLKNTVLCPID